MKALLLHAPSQLSLVDVEKPTPGPREVLLRVRAVGICGSDIHGWDGSTGRRRPPVIMGHEAAAEVESVGAGVDDWRPGDRVTFDSTLYCGECGPCRAGEVNLCVERRVLGVSCADYRQDGAFTEYLVLPARLLMRLPDGLTFIRAAMVEPVSIAMHAVSRAGEPGDTATVVGAGMIGLLVVQALKLAGWQRVLAVDINDDRLQLARKLGAAAVVNSRDARQAADELNKLAPDGAAVAIEVVGIEPTVDLAIRCARRGGRVVFVGNLSPVVPIPLQAVVTNEIAILGSCASAGEYPAALEAIASGGIAVDPLISAVAPLADGIQWFERLHAAPGDQLKVILQP